MDHLVAQAERVGAVSLARFAKKRDSAEPDIIAALRAARCRVWQLDRPFDLLVGHGGRFTVLEVKSMHRVRKDQAKQTAELHDAHAGGLPVYRVQTVEDALQAVGLVR